MMARFVWVLVSILFCLPFASAHEGHVSSPPPWQEVSDWPDRIIVSPGADPQTSFSVTWRTSARVSSAIAELVEASGDSRFDLGARAYGAHYERVDLDQVTYAASRTGTPNEGLEAVHHHSVLFEDLKPDTLYAYRVRGSRGHWSEWYQTRTAAEDGPISFLYYGDAQYGILSHASRIFRQGLLSAPNVSFILHAGDLVNKGDRDLEWAEWFEASGFIHAMIPVLPVAGNHEYLETAEGGAKDGKAILTDLWRPQFTLPVETGLPEALHETVYEMRYGPDLHVFVLDSSSPLWEEQMAWLEEASKASNATWKVVGMHHSPFRPGIQGYANNPRRGDYHRDRQNKFVRAARRAGVHLILAGHNHSYTRASLGPDVGPGLPEDEEASQRRTPREVEMVVMVSISGAMSGTMTPERYASNAQKFGNDIALERWANNTPTYQVVSVDGKTLSVTSHIATSEIYDAFTLSKMEDGTVMMTNDEAAFGPVRRFETTGPYADKSDLR